MNRFALSTFAILATASGMASAQVSGGGIQPFVACGPACAPGAVPGGGAAPGSPPAGTPIIGAPTTGGGALPTQPITGTPTGGLAACPAPAGGLGGLGGGFRTAGVRR